MIRTSGLLLAIAATLLVSLDTASAARGGRSSGTSVERDRANSRDPSGTYRNYPAWAASAFSPRGGAGR